MGLLFVLFQRAHRAAIEARRRASTAGYLGWSALAAGSLVIALVVLLSFAAQLWMLGLWMIAVAMLAICLLPTLGPWILRHALVPAGRVKAAYHCGRYSVVAGTDPEAHALVAAAWAVAAAKRPVSGQSIAWVQEKIEARGKLGDAEVVAAAFLLLRRDGERQGDGDGERNGNGNDDSNVAAARQLLRSVAELAELHPAVRELAGEWLAVDAAERGAWSELLPAAAAAEAGGKRARAKARHGAYPATPLRFFLEGVAAVRLGDASAPSAAALYARWLLAPYRRHTRALLATPPLPRAAAGNDAAKDAANDAAKDAATGESGAAVTGAGEAGAAAANASAAANDSASVGDASAARGAVVPSLEEALALHVRSLGALRDAAGVHQLAASWDGALEAAETKAWLARRAAELGAVPGAAERAVDEVMETVASELRAAIERLRLPSPPPLRSRFGALLGAKLRHGRLDELELQFTHWADRVCGGAKLGSVDEWREFLAVRQSYRDLVASGGGDLRRLAFPHVFEAANRAAVELWNRRDELNLAHAILAWELEEARAVGDAAAIELAAKNSALKFSTRTGVWGE